MKDMLVYRQEKKVEVQAPKGFAYSLAGEVLEENHFLIEIVENAIQIAVPER
jgi:diacylglycerol kinase (ATP)